MYSKSSTTVHDMHDHRQQTSEYLPKVAEVEAQCAKCAGRRIGDEVAKSACYLMAGLVGDLMKVKAEAYDATSATSS